MPQEVKKTKTPEQALAALMAQCAKAERSTDDARRLLRRWGIDPKEQDRIVDALVAQRFIDDKRYTEAFVRDKMRFSNWGVYKIRSALAMKRIDPEIVAEALAMCDEMQSGGRLEKALRVKVKQLKAKNEYDRKVKLMRYGLSLGFGMDEVTEAVENILVEWKNQDEE